VCLNREDEMTWEQADREWSGLALAEMTPDDGDQLQAAYQAGWDDCAANIATGTHPTHGADE
jgi:hypothetical protein